MLIFDKEISLTLQIVFINWKQCVFPTIVKYKGDLFKQYYVIIIYNVVITRKSINTYIY